MFQEEKEGLGRSLKLPESTISTFEVFQVRTGGTPKRGGTGVNIGDSDVAGDKVAVGKARHKGESARRECFRK